MLVWRRICGARAHAVPVHRFRATAGGYRSVCRGLQQSAFRPDLFQIMLGIVSLNELESTFPLRPI